MRRDDPQHYDVLVIGAGPAGTSAALRAAELGARVAVVEAERTGGTCVNTGCVPTRVLAKTARLAREVRIAHRWGLAVSDPVIDWPSTVARVRSTVDEVRDLKAEPERFAKAGIDLVLEGRARFADATTLELASGRRLTGDSIIVAVGGHSRPLPIPGAELATVPVHVLDLPALPERVAIIGAGNTGAQLVTVFSAFGSQVTLLDVAPRILAVADEQISDAVGAAFAEQGIVIHAGIETVESLSRAHDGSITLTWREAGAAVAASFDAVVMATGWPADVEGLGLEVAASRRCGPRSRWISTSEAPSRTSTPSATPTAATCSSRPRISRARQRPRTPCSTRIGALRTTCCRRAASPIRTTPGWGSPKPRHGRAIRNASWPSCRTPSWIVP